MGKKKVEIVKLSQHNTTHYKAIFPRGPKALFFPTVTNKGGKKKKKEKEKTSAHTLSNPSHV